jgi:hypothetical protein
MAVIITTKERNWKRILPQAENPKSRVDSDEEEKAVPAYSHRSTTGKPAGPFQYVISVILRLHFIATNINYIMTVYDTKSGPHTTIILLDTANKQTNKLMDGDAVQRFSVSRRTTNEKNSNNCTN